MIHQYAVSVAVFFVGHIREVLGDQRLCPLKAVLEVIEHDAQHVALEARVHSVPPIGMVPRMRRGCREGRRGEGA